MGEYAKFAPARYQQVAVDIASKIADGQYQVGDKLYARSQVASQYCISPETARRAIAILSDMGIVETAKGSGVLVRSYEKALAFVRHSRDTNTLSELRQSAVRQSDQLAEEIMRLRETVADLVDHTDQFHFTNPFVPFKAPIEPQSTCIGLSLSELNFWHNTAATVVAVRRGERLLLSPGPYEALKAGDVLYYIGDEGCAERVKHFLRNFSPQG
ncbi:MAG TPA: GntR family transcriptional regulator [Candidatus Acidoferrum sp.]|nr:GntR family transcriptional regulator [Candidatus Acidoferrum sp.]